MSGYSSSGGSRVTVVTATVTTGDISVPDTGGAWALLAGIAELQIPASAGNTIGLNVVGLRKSLAAVDAVIVTGGGPTIQKYMASGFTSTPGFDGEPSWYQDASFSIRGGEVCFVAQSGDIDSGVVRFRIASKIAGANGTFYASANYPFKWNATNYG